MAAQGSSGSGSRRKPIAPLYQRLPHGPHRLEAREVARHQRARMHGAMIESVAANGYELTSVRQVVGLAGVSRRSFYEQFANKQECFLSTFDALTSRCARRVGDACREAGGELEQCLQAAFTELCAAIQDNWNGARLVILETPALGAPGLLRTRAAAARFEQALSDCFEQAPEACALPGPVIRAIAGGLHGAIWMWLSEGSPAQAPELAEELLGWTLLFQTPAAERLAERLLGRARATLAAARTPANANGRRDGKHPARPARDAERSGSGAPGAGAAGGERERLLQQALRLLAVEDYGELSVAQIADAAGLSIDAFFASFEHKEECVLAALEMLGEQLLALSGDPQLSSADWAPAVRRVIGELGGHLAEHPIYAQALAGGAFAAGPQASRLIVRLLHTIAWRLTCGAPLQARSAIAVEGVAGALAHTVHCQVASGQIGLLPVLSDYLSYVVLAPFIGAEEAAAIVCEELPSAACPRVYADVVPRSR